MQAMGSIRIVTEVPGPRSRELAQRAARSVAHPVMPAGEIFISHGEGALITDVDGNRFIDLMGGVGCLIVGHAHPGVTRAVRDQVDRSLHSDFSLVPYEGYLALAERLSEACGGNRKVAFFNSGAEAVENAVKIARGATGRPGLICFEGAFHGRTLMALSLTHRETPHKKGFGPFAPEVYRVPFPGRHETSLEDSLRAVEQTLRDHDVAAIVVEPILGEGGFVVPPPGFLSEVARISAAHGAVFIADEIQSGYGRTGSFLASDHFGVRPDLVLLGKSIAAGLPLSAVVGEPRWMDALEPNAIGGTYVGNPVACAAALAVLEIIDSEKLVGRAVEVGEILTSGWNALREKYDAIREVRGLGAMVGVEFAGGRVLKALLSQATRRGVLAMTAGKEAKVLRHLMPLVITDGQLAEALRVFDDCLREGSRVQPGAG